MFFHRTLCGIDGRICALPRFVSVGAIHESPAKRYATKRLSAIRPACYPFPFFTFTLSPVCCQPVAGLLPSCKSERNFRPFSEAGRDLHLRSVERRLPLARGAQIADKLHTQRITWQIAQTCYLLQNQWVEHGLPPGGELSLASKAKGACGR